MIETTSDVAATPTNPNAQNSLSPDAFLDTIDFAILKDSPVTIPLKDGQVTIQNRSQLQDFILTPKYDGLSQYTEAQVIERIADQFPTIQKKPLGDNGNPDDYNEVDSSKMAKTDPDMWTKLGNNVFLMDLDDPYPFQRAATSIGGSLTGAYLGGKAGAKIGSPFGLKGKVIGGGIGAFLGELSGSVAGSATPDLVARVLNLASENGYENNFKTLSNDELKRVMMAEVYLHGMFTVLSATSRVGGKQISNFANKITPQMKEFADLSGRRLSLDNLPLTVGARAYGLNVVNVLGRMPYIGRGAQKNEATYLRNVYKVAKGLPSRIAPTLGSLSDLGRKIYAEATTTMNKFSESYDQKYKEVFDTAESYGLIVSPNSAKAYAQSMLDAIKRDQPTTIVNGKKKEFLSNNVTRRVNNVVQEVLNLDNMTLKQADEALQRINAQIGEAFDVSEREGASVYRLLKPLKDAIKTDVINNVSSPFTNIGGGLAVTKDQIKEVTNTLAKLDAEYSREITALIDTPVTKRIETVSGKLGSTGSSTVTTQSIDSLVKIILDLNEPSVVEELSRLVTPETMNQIAATFVQKALKESVEEVAQPGRASTFVLNAEPLKSLLGSSPLKKQADGILETVTASDKTRKQTIDILLKNSDIKRADLELFLQNIENSIGKSVPNASTFLQRSMQISGGRAKLGSQVAKVMTYGLAGGALYSNPLSALTVLFGTRAFLSALTNPMNAQSVRNMIGEEITTIAYRNAWINLFASLLGATVETGDQVVDTITDAVDKKSPTLIKKALEVEAQKNIDKAKEMGANTFDYVFSDDPEKSDEALENLTRQQ